MFCLKGNGQKVKRGKGKGEKWKGEKWKGKG